LEAEFEKIMSGEKDDMEDEADEEEAEMDMEAEAVEEPTIEETSEVEESSEEATEDKVEEGSEDELELDLEESDEDSDDAEEKLEEYKTPMTAKAGDNGDNAKSPVNANPKRPGDDSSAAPVKTHDGNTAGGKGDAPKDMATKNVNVSGNSKAPAMKPASASAGDDGANTKSVSS
jgi:hypothetical protein